MEKSLPTDRYHALDSLRCFAMFLGILLHVVMTFKIKMQFLLIILKKKKRVADFIFLLVLKT